MTTRGNTMNKFIYFLFGVLVSTSALDAVQPHKQSNPVQIQTSHTETAKVRPFQKAQQKKLASLYKKEFRRYTSLIEAFNKVKTTSGKDYSRALDELREHVAILSKQHVRLWDFLRHTATFFVGAFTALFFLPAFLLNPLRALNLVLFALAIPTLFGIITSLISRALYSETYTLCSATIPTTISNLRFRLKRLGENPLEEEIEHFISQLEDIKNFLRAHDH